MNALEPIAYLVATDLAFHAHLSHAEVPEAALAAHRLPLTDTERELVECLRSLLVLPAGALLSRLLDDGPDGDPPWQWYSSLSLATYLP
ncbi:MAG: hypothetical protein U9R05_06675 [Chloroflexota bacterium]|nr:hypothetical protein [Chloroflexota bacterium]